MGSLICIQNKSRYFTFLAPLTSGGLRPFWFAAAVRRPFIHTEAQPLSKDDSFSALGTFLFIGCEFLRVNCSEEKAACYWQKTLRFSMHRIPNFHSVHSNLHLQFGMNVLFCPAFFLSNSFQRRRISKLYKTARCSDLRKLFIGHHFSQRRSFTQMNMTHHWIE